MPSVVRQQTGVGSVGSGSVRSANRVGNKSFRHQGTIEKALQEDLNDLDEIQMVDPERTSNSDPERTMNPSQLSLPPVEEDPEEHERRESQDHDVEKLK